VSWYRNGHTSTWAKAVCHVFRDLSCLPYGFRGPVKEFVILSSEQVIASDSRLVLLQLLQASV
jgi:hypothetical protein